jgi:hypothetical protein
MIELTQAGFFRIDRLPSAMGLQYFQFHEIDAVEVQAVLTYSH